MTTAPPPEASTPPAALPDPAAAKRRFCDIVMKGGVASGVVYPRAVYEISRESDFRGIGGTSAGAVAAAATAAAAYGRRLGHDSFATLEKLPQWLGARSPDGRSNLFSLFQPAPSTRALFSLVTAALGNAEGRIRRMSTAAVVGYWPAFLLGMVPGLLVALLAWLPGHGLLRAALVALAVILALAGGFIAVAHRIKKDLLRKIPANFYGICPGHAAPAEAEADRIATAPLPLTDWLTEYLNELAGKPMAEGPLTFADLWGTRDAGAERLVDLQVMTTNLTHGRPYRIPFETRIFFFDPEEFRRLFPAPVVDWMVRHAGDTAMPNLPDTLLPLPDPADLPVVVAARLSLSFPLLISAVPLYAIDYSLREEGQAPPPERCWFSDGGISSNFPVHFFDLPLPRWPTFAINLRPFHKKYGYSEDQSRNVWMPRSHGGGILEWWHRFDEAARGGSLLGFLGAIANAAQNWMDNMQLSIPGYRDRVVHVSLRPSEGGLNLNMPADLIAELAERGCHAGRMLVDRFGAAATDDDPSWDSHRWVRLRATMAALEETLTELCDVYHNPQPGDRSYAGLIVDAGRTGTLGYRWRSEEQLEFAREALDDLCQLVERWGDAPQTFQVGAPRPQPDLRLRPSV